MTPQQTTPEDIFHKAVELSDRTERSEYLAQACEGDEKLRAEVDALLKWHEEAGDFLESPAVEPAVTLETSAPSEAPGTIIGRYKLLEKVGEGGMAVVYMAEQKRPIRRRVALKIIKLGMDTKSVIARFEAERQALAMMDHPNIAHVLDAGATDTGRPYFVMELVRGVSITEFCDKNNLSTEERLELFVSVCQAVHHAHQKGVIHRDIKPSNVMVTLHDGEPVPKVIDFGIAKAVNQQLTEKTVFTRYAQMIGTPEYMSPEQAEMSGLDVDIRTDVFSLGVLLYELLTGTTPFDPDYLRNKGYAELQRIIREEEPTRPSTKISTLGEALTEIAKHRRTSPDLLQKLIRTDLDWIVMKSLEKDRKRRYDSVSEFVADIRRHLNHEPVLAGRPGPVYKLMKFVRRRRALATAAAMVAAVVVVGFVVSTAMYVRAERARAKEAVAHSQAQAVTDFLTNDLLASVNPEKAKSPEVTVRYVLDAASESLEGKFEGRPLVEAKIRETLGLTYVKLGDDQAAEPHLKFALEARRRHLGQKDPLTLTSLGHLGRLYRDQARYDDAEPLLAKTLEARRRVLGEEHADTIESMCDLGVLYVLQGRFNDAEPLLAKALEMGQQALGEEHPVVLQAMLGRAWQYVFTGQVGEVERLSSKGYDISRRVLGDEHNDTVWFMMLLAWVYGRDGRYGEAVPLAANALEISQRVVGDEHPTTAMAMTTLGGLYSEQGRYDEAFGLLTESVDIGCRVVGEEHPYTLLLRRTLAGLYYAQGRYAEVEAVTLEALEVSRRVLGEEHWLTWRFGQDLHSAIKPRGLIARQQYDIGEYDNALATLTRQEELCRVCDIEMYASDVALRAMSLHRLGRDQEAKSALDRLRRRYEHSDYAGPEKRLYEVERLFADVNSRAYQAWGLIEAGELQKASEILGALQTPPHRADAAMAASIQSITKALARAYWIRGKSSEAHGDYRQAIDDYEAAAHVYGDYAPALYELAWLRATCAIDEIRHGAKAIKLATKACELTNWEKTEYINALAAAHAEVGNFATAVQRQKTAIALLPKEAQARWLAQWQAYLWQARWLAQWQAEYELRLQLYASGKPYHRHKERSMVAWWKLDEAVGGIVPDSSGNGLDGRLMGNARIISDAVRGSVLSLDGGGDYVDCGKAPGLKIADFITISAWIKIDAFDTFCQAIVTKGDSTWRIQRHRDEDGVQFSCNGLDVPSDPRSWSAVRGKKRVDDGKWHHIAGVYNGTRMDLYVDCDVDASASARGKVYVNDESLCIGENSEFPGRAWKGLIDDVRIYNYALSEAEIKALYDGKGPGTTEK